MKITAIVVGIGGWEEYTRPLIDGIKQHSPSVNVVCIDNLSDDPYPEDYRVTRTPRRMGYAAAMNYGLSLTEISDWYMPMNNDISISGDLVHVFRGLDPHCLHGPAINKVAGMNDGDFLNGWIYAISGELLKTIGLFDEAFKVNWFEDADYSFRAKAAGFPLRILNTEGMGLYHFGEERPDWEGHRSNYRDIYEANKKYLKEKYENV